LSQKIGQQMVGKNQATKLGNYAGGGLDWVCGFQRVLPDGLTQQIDAIARQRT